MSYYTEAHLDILDDYDCLCTVYQFTTEELAKEFTNSVPFVCTQVQFSEKPLEFKNTTNVRPIYSKIEDAMEDAQQFYEYADTPNYRYYQNVYRVPLEQIERIFNEQKYSKLEEKYNTLQKEVKKLTEKIEALENKELQNKVKDLSIN
jgi:hypothetical protein